MNEQIIELIAVENKKRVLKEQLDELNKQEEELKTTILDNMKENDMKTFENEEIRITYIAPTTRTSIDSSKLKKEFPEIAEQCTKVSPIEESWKITLK